MKRSELIPSFSTRYLITSFTRSQLSCWADLLDSPYPITATLQPGLFLIFSAMVEASAFPSLLRVTDLPLNTMLGRSPMKQRALPPVPTAPASIRGVDILTAGRIRAFTYTIGIHRLTLGRCNKFFILTIRNAVTICIPANSMGIHRTTCRSIGFMIELIRNSITVSIIQARVWEVSYAWEH